MSSHTQQQQQRRGYTRSIVAWKAPVALLLFMLCSTVHGSNLVDKSSGLPQSNNNDNRVVEKTEDKLSESTLPNLQNPVKKTVQKTVKRGDEGLSGQKKLPSTPPPPKPSTSTNSNKQSNAERELNSLLRDLDTEIALSELDELASSLDKKESEKISTPPKTQETEKKKRMPPKFEKSSRQDAQLDLMSHLSKKEGSETVLSRNSSPLQNPGSQLPRTGGLSLKSNTDPTISPNRNDQSVPKSKASRFFGVDEDVLLKQLTPSQSQKQEGIGGSPMNQKKVKSVKSGGFSVDESPLSSSAPSQKPTKQRQIMAEAAHDLALPLTKLYDMVKEQLKKSIPDEDLTEIVKVLSGENGVFQKMRTAGIPDLLDIEVSNPPPELAKYHGWERLFQYDALRVLSGNTIGKVRVDSLIKLRMLLHLLQQYLIFFANVNNAMPPSKQEAQKN